MYARPPRPTAAEFLAAFDETICGVIGPRPVVRNLSSGPGWGRSGTAITHLRLSYRVGRRREDVEVDVMNTPQRFSPKVMVLHLLFRGLIPMIDDSTEFPLELRVERTEFVIPMDGHGQRFSGFTFASRTTVVGDAHGLTVTLTGPRELLPRLKLGTLDPEGVKRWLDASERKRDGTQNRLRP